MCRAQRLRPGRLACALLAAMGSGLAVFPATAATPLTGNVTTPGSQTYNDEVTLEGDTNLASTGYGDITFGSTLDGAHALTVNTGGAVVFTGPVGGTTALYSLTSNSGTFLANAMTINGPLSVSTTGGYINQGGAFNVAGRSSFDAGSGSITLTNAGNLFAGLVDLAGGTTRINAASSLLLGTVDTGALTATSHGTLDLGTGSIGGDLVATSNDGAIVQGGALNVAGSSTIDAGTGAITLDNAGNTFAGPVGLTGGTTRINGANALTLGTVATGALTATSHGMLNLGAGSVGGDLVATSNNGAIVQTGALSVAGSSTIDAGTGAITLSNAGNTFVGPVSLAGNNVILVNDRATRLGTTTVTGNLDVASNGAISQTGAATVTGLAAFIQNSTTAGATQDIDLGSQDNSFQGDVIFMAGLGAGINNLSLRNTATGAGALMLPSSVAGNVTLDYTAAALALPVVNAGGALDVTAAGGITFNGGVTTGGAQTYHSPSTLGTSVRLASNGNDAITFESTVDGAHTLAVSTGGVTTFGGAVGGTTALTSLMTDGGGSTVLGGNVTTDIMQYYYDAVTLAADITLRSINGTVYLFSTLDGAQALTIDTPTAWASFMGNLGSTTALASLATTAGTGLYLGGDVTTSGAQTYGGAVQLWSSASHTLTGSDITFDSTLDGGGQALTVNASGDVRFVGTVGGTTALGSLTSNSGTFSANAMTLSGPLSVTTTSGDITQGGAFNVVGVSSFDAGSDAITLTNAGNQFAGRVDLAGGTTRINGANALTLGTLATGALTATSHGMLNLGAGSVGGDLVATSNDGAIVQAGALSVAGNTTIDAGTNTIRLVAPDNAFTGAISLNGGDALLANNGATRLGGITATGMLHVASNGAISQTDAATVTGLAVFVQNSITAGATQDIDLGSQDNSFQGDVMFMAGPGAGINNLSLRNTATSAGTLVLPDSVAGNLTLDYTAAALELPVADVGGSLDVTAAGGITIKGNISTGGTQTYHDMATLGTSVVLASPGDGAITFGSTLDGAHALTVRTGGVTTFAGALGATTALKALEVSGGGSTVLGGNVTTGGMQFYNDVTLGGDITLSSLNGTVHVISTLDGAHALTLDTPMGEAILWGDVGGTTALASLTTRTGGRTYLGGDVTTSGAQTYDNAVGLLPSPSHTLTGSDVTFGSTLDGGSALTVNASGVTRFGGAVGGTVGLASLTTDAAGSTWLGGSVTTTGMQTYNDAVTLGANVTLAGSTVSLVEVAGGGSSLGVAGNAVLNGAVAGVNELLVSGTTALDGGSVSTTGAQIYLDSATLGADTTLATSGNGTIAFGSLVDGAHALVVNTGGAVSFGGAVGRIAPLTRLASSSGTFHANDMAIDGPLSVTTTNGDIMQGGAFDVAGASSFDAGSSDIVLVDEGNDFAGAVQLTGNNASIIDRNVLNLGPVMLGGSLDALAAGIWQSGAARVVGATSLTSHVGGILLDNAGNDFTGGVSIDSEGEVILVDANDLHISSLRNGSSGPVSLAAGTGLWLDGVVSTVGDITLSGGTGSIVQTGGSLIAAGLDGGAATLGNVTLEGAGNRIDRLGSFDAAGFNLVNTAAMLIDGRSTITGDMRLTGPSFTLVGSVDAGSTTLGPDTSMDIGNGGTVGTLAGDLNLEAGSSASFRHSDDLAYAGSIAGTGTLRQQGTGTLVLDGDSSGFAGSTIVGSGALLVGGDAGSDAVLGGNVAVAAGALLGGHGHIAGDVTNAGILAPGASLGTLSIGGDYTQAATGVMQVEAYADGRSDTLVVGGTATLEGSMLALAQDGVWRPMTSYTILTAAGGVAGQFGSATSSLVFLDPLLAYGTNDVTLTLVRNDIAFASAAQTSNQAGVAAAADALGWSNPVYERLTTLDASSAAAAFDSLSGEIHAATRGALLGDSRHLREALVRQMVPMEAGDRGGAWLTGWGHWSHTDGDGNAAAVDGDGSGFAIGGDVPVGNRIRLGALVGGGRVSVDSDGRASEADVSSRHVGAYALVDAGVLRIQAGAVRSTHDIDSRRPVVVGDYAESLRGDADADTTQAYLDVSRRFAFGRNVLAPFANVARVRVHGDAFDETGGSAALHVDAGTDEQTVSTFGARWDWTPRSDTVRFRGAAAWMRITGDDNGSTTARFVDGVQGFGVAGPRVAGDALAMDLGLHWQAGARTTVEAMWNGRFGDGERDRGASVAVRMGF